LIWGGISAFATPTLAARAAAVIAVFLIIR